MKISSSILRKILSGIFGIKHFTLIASLVFFAIISVALYLIFENAQIMLERIKADFNQMQLVLAHQTATQIDSDLLAISKELEILDNLVDSSIRTFNERTHLEGVEAAGLINSENEVSHYSEYNEIGSGFDKFGKRGFALL
jgi:type II secretory pathway pseudopilin PulG